MGLLITISLSKHFDEMELPVTNYRISTAFRNVSRKRFEIVRRFEETRPAPPDEPRKHTAESRRHRPVRAVHVNRRLTSRGKNARQP